MYICKIFFLLPFTLRRNPLINNQKEHRHSQLTIQVHDCFNLICHYLTDLSTSILG